MQRINHYPADKHKQKQLSYRLESDLSGGLCYRSFEQLGLGPSGSRSFSCYLKLKMADVSSAFSEVCVKDL